MTTETHLPKFPIGTQFLSSGKHPRLCEVVDVWVTFNNAGQVVHFRYVAKHTFLGQTVRQIDVLENSVARGVWDLDKAKGQEAS
jgi:hypothetical protein